MTSFYLSSEWWKLYADFPAHTRNNGRAEVPEVPIFASVVHYYAALRGLNTQEIATALGWPQANAKQILNSLERPEYRQHCVDVCRYLGIPHRLRESALQRAGRYQVEESLLPKLDETQAEIYAKQGYMLTPEETTQLRLYLKEHSMYGVKDEPLGYETLKTYDSALEVMRFFMQPNWQEIKQCQDDGRLLPNFDFRSALEGLEKWLEHFERDLKYAIWERRDQLLYIAYHFYELGTTLWSRKPDRGMPCLDSPLALHYKTKAFQAAEELGNITFIMKTLLDRAEIYYAQRRYEQALQDAREAVRYGVIEYRTLRPQVGRYDISPYDDDVDIIGRLAERSDGMLRDEFNKLYDRVLSIREEAQAREQAELVPDDDFDAGDLAEEEADFAVKDAVEKGDDFAFEDWDEEENEDIEEEVGWYGTGRNAVKREKTESRRHVFPLGSGSDAVLQDLVDRYDYPDKRDYDDVYDAVRRVLGKGKEQREVAVDLLIAGLNHKKHEVRAKSALMLSELHVSEAVDLLVEALADEDGRVRWCAASALGNLQDMRAVKPLINLLISEDSKARLKIAMQRDRHAEQQKCQEHRKRWERRWSSTSAKPEYWDNESKVRVCAAEALGALNDVDAVKPLIALLLDEEWRERRRTYAAQKHEESKNPFLALLVGHENALLCQVIKALGKLGDARAIEPLNMILLEEGEMAYNALDALQGIRDPQVLPALIAALGHGLALLHHNLPEVVSDIILKSNEQQREEAVGLLLAALSSPAEDTRFCAARVLGRLREARAAAPVIALLQEQNSAVRSEVISVLALIPDAQVVEALIAHLNAKDQWERERAAEVLGRLGDTRAVDPLVACLVDEDEGLRKRVVRALGLLGDQRAIEPLEKLLEHDQSRDLQPDIFRALCQLHDEVVYKRLLLMLKKTKDESKLAWIAEAVGEFGDPQAIKPLLRLVHTARKKEACNNAVLAIQKIGGKQAVAALIQIVQDVRDPQDVNVSKLTNLRYDDRYSVRDTCVYSLKALGDPAAVASLLPWVKSRYMYYVKKQKNNVIEAIASFNDPRMLEPFIAVLTDEVLLQKESLGSLSIDWELVAPVITALGELGDPAALPILRHVARFTGGDFFDLSHKSRVEYRVYGIGEKTLVAIERLTLKPVVTEEMQSQQLQLVPKKV